MSGSGDDRPRAPSSRPPSLIQGRVTGARHVRDGRVCQDAIGGVVSGGVAVLAVADGHGTSLHGDVGAAIAVAVAVEHLTQFAAALGPERDVRSAHAHARDVLRGQLVREWTARVRAQAGDDGADLVPYGSTLIFALATSAYLLVGQLGDGDLLLVDSSGLVTRPLAPDPNNFAEETSSLCQKDAWATLRVLATPAPAANTLLLLSTDGYSKSYATDAIFEMIAPGVVSQKIGEMVMRHTEETLVMPERVIRIEANRRESRHETPVPPSCRRLRPVRLHRNPFLDAARDYIVTLLSQPILLQERSPSASCSLHPVRSQGRR